MGSRISSCVLVLLLICMLGSAFAEAGHQRPRIESIEVLGGHQDILIYVLDGGNDEIIVLDTKGNLIRRISIAMEDGSNSNSYALSGLCVISNRAGIRNISPEGKVNPSIPSLGDYTDRIMAVDPTGKFYYPNKEQNKVEIYHLPISINVTYDLAMKITKEEWQKMAEAQQVRPGHPQAVIDGNVTGPAHLGRPHRVDAPNREYVWVLDQSYKYKVFKWEGKDDRMNFVREIKAPDKGNRSFTDVTGVRCERDNTEITYIACRQTKTILKFDEHISLVKSIPAGCKPCGLAVDNNGLLYVADDFRGGPDGKQPEIRVLNQSGKLLRTIKIPLEPIQ